MPIANGQTIAFSQAGVGILTSGNLTTQATGSCFIIAAAVDVGEFSSLADSKGNTYVRVGTLQSFDSSGADMHVFYCENGVGGAAHNWTIDVTGVSEPISGVVLEVTGGVLSGILDQSGQRNDTASPFTLTSGLTTTQANELLVAIMAGNSGSASATHAESTGFSIASEVVNGASVWTLAIAYRNVTATGTYNCSFTEAGGTNAGVFLLTFKELGAGGGNTTITPSAGSLTLAGIASSVLTAFTIAPLVGALVLNGITPTVAVPGSIMGATGSLSLVGAAPVIGQSRFITPNAGALVLTGNAASVSTPGRITPQAGTLTLTGFDAPQTLTVPSPDAGVLALTGNLAVVTQGIMRTPTAGSLTLNGVQAGVFQPIRITPNVATLALTGVAPTVVPVNAVVPGTAALVMAGVAPVVTQQLNISPQTGALTLTANLALILTSSPLIIPGSGALNFTGLTPTGFAAGGSGSPGPGTSSSGISGDNIEATSITGAGVSG